MASKPAEYGFLRADRLYCRPPSPLWLWLEASLTPFVMGSAPFSPPESKGPAPPKS
jgi:hypothetical protein